MLHIPELLIIAAGLSMDAFAAAICKGLGMKNIKWGHAIIIGLYFGLFQAVMPYIGYRLGIRFEAAIHSLSYFAAFFLLSAIGIAMIRESHCPIEECEVNASIHPLQMAALATATSIDALAIGVTFAFLQVEILSAITVIGLVTLCCSIGGVRIGAAFGGRYKCRAEFCGGLVLLLMGIKFLLEHLFILWVHI